MVPAIASNCTEGGLNDTLSNRGLNASNCTDTRPDAPTSSGNIRYIAIGAAGLVILLVVFFTVVGIVVGISRFTVQQQRKQGENGDRAVDSDYSAYIFMEASRVSAGAQKVRHKPTDPSAGYVEVTEHQISEAQDYEVPRSTSSEGIDTLQHQYENRGSWVGGQSCAYENHEVACIPSQEDKKRCSSPLKAEDYENQEVIEAQFKYLENLDTLSASYVAPNPSPPKEVTNSKIPKSLGPTYINTQSNKCRPSKSTDKHTYLTIVQ